MATTAQLAIKTAFATPITKTRPTHAFVFLVHSLSAFFANYNNLMFFYFYIFIFAIHTLNLSTNTKTVNRKCSNFSTTVDSGVLRVYYYKCSN